MKANEFHITVQRDRVLLSWQDQQEVPYRLASGLEKDRLIARILHKVLNMRLAADDMGVLGRDEFKVLGATLFKLLFDDEDLKRYFSEFYKLALGSANERNRLILEFDKDAADMATLPWEYLYYEEDEAQEAFLAAHPKKCLDLIRKLPFKGNWLEFDKTKQSIAPPLKVLVIIADPDRAEKNIDPKQALVYFQKLEEQFAQKIKFKLLYQPEVDSFSEKLNQIVKKEAEEFFPHIIHFIGYSRMDGTTGEICFVKKSSEEKYEEKWISEDSFAGYFEEWTRLPYLMFLHICDSVPIGDYKADKGIAIKLAKKGIPFVLALQNPTLDWMAQILVEKIYEGLIQGEDLAAATTEARFFLARKLVDANGNKYDNYAHKVFGSTVLFSVVQRPFALALNTPKSDISEQKDTYKTCVEHPDKKYSLGDNWCTVCGKKLILPSQLSETSVQESAMSDSSQAQSAAKPASKSNAEFNISVAILDRSPKPTGVPESAQNPGLNIADKDSFDKGNSSAVLTETRTVSLEAILKIEQEGLTKQLELLLKKKNFLVLEQTKTNDAGQLFELGEEIRVLEEQIDAIKLKLNI
ncbi:MAG: CHAT domain-containing protein [Saprospiraceae bacterium]|nr:CHAT domain-containing protein [Saprospiraceae bacterium]